MFEAQIAKGMEVLDRYDAENGYTIAWYKRVTLETLELSSCERCVLGQLFDEDFDTTNPYQDGLVALGLSSSYSADHGFSVGGKHGLETVTLSYRLTQEWKDAILKRLEAAAFEEALTDAKRLVIASPHCAMCGTVVEYQMMGNGEEWALRKCDYCERPLCEKDAIKEGPGGFTSCLECLTLELEQ